MIFLIIYIFRFELIFIPRSDFFTNRPFQLSSCSAFAPFWPCPIHSLSTILRYPRNTVSKQQQNILLLLLLFLSKLSKLLLISKAYPSLTWSLALILLQIGHSNSIPVLLLCCFGHVLSTVLSIQSSNVKLRPTGTIRSWNKSCIISCNTKNVFNWNKLLLFQKKMWSCLTILTNRY